MKDAYFQLEVDKASQHYLVIATYLGYLKYLCMPFGISSGLATWQRTINTILHGIFGVSAFIDDIIITGFTYSEHLKNLRFVLQLLLDAGITTQLIKCLFRQSIAVYMAHRIEKYGIHPAIK